MASENSDIAIDTSILAVLGEINQQVKSLLQQQQNGDSKILLELNEAVKNLSGKISAFTEALGEEKEYKVEVKLDGADGAIHDLVSRVVEEVIIRVKQENLLTVTNG